ncbi:MAG: type III pantothenate kinase [Eubacteriales bacterium]
MTLAVDIGNTSICLGVFECGERLVFRAKLASDHRKSADEYAVLISGVFRMHGADLSTIERAVMLSVVPALTHTVCEALGAFGIKPLIVGSGVKTGLCLRVDTPEPAGTDIVADTVAAMRTGPPVIVIDLGTATTITVINEKASSAAVSYRRA